MEQASELLSAAKVDDKGIKDVTAESIKDIIKRGRCLCVEIKEGNEYFNNLIEALKFVLLNPLAQPLETLRMIL